TDDALVERLSRLNLAGVALYEGAFENVATSIAKTIRRRVEIGFDEPLNIMLCVNAVHVVEIFDGVIRGILNDEEIGYYEKNVGLCVTMVQSNGANPPEGENPWLVLVSDRPSLSVDGDPWKGERIDDVPEISYTTNGIAKIFRKVFIGNMSHAMNAYIGSAHGMNFLDEGIMDDAWAQANIQLAREEATLAVTSEFEFEPEELAAYFNRRSSNSKPQHDPFKRIGNSPEKKISYDNRYIWPARMCLKHGRLPFHLCMGAAYGLLYIVNGNGAEPVERPTNRDEVKALVERFCGLGDKDYVIRDLVIDQYLAIPEAGIIPAAE
ncbi:MAG: hypothetical protein IJH87_01345, partial [Atopobiaceae bacterium]|nr:hypothetical protein [Atopobiaceae bacterium]